MQRSIVLIFTAALVTVVCSAGQAGAADVKVGVNIAIPAPPVVLAPPPVVLVPGTPVHHVPTANFNLFVYRSRYYSFHNGAWFVASGPNAPWSAVAVEAVPPPVRGVPVKHYKIPPGHAKKAEAQEGGWCPPGQAKKGRC
jgi:hypothetical protein